MKRHGPALMVAAAVLLLAACGDRQPSMPTSQQDCKPGDGISRAASTRSYQMVMVLSPGMEAMYTHEQVQEQHPASGEEMISGTMSNVGGSGTSQDMGGMSHDMGGASHGGDSAVPGNAAASTVRHLEVHICSAASGRVVADAQPTISIKDDAGQQVEVPVAVMQGVDAGRSDLHYGNNVEVKPGHSYTVQVGIRGENASFHFGT